MSELLASYVAGAWYTATDEGRVVADASTGETVARVSSSGFDARAMVEHARRVGGPALRRLTFPERAALLKTLAAQLSERKDAYYELSYATGATKRDSAVDIDGGIGTTFAFAGIGSRELPEGKLLVDGDLVPMGKQGTFAGRHVYTPLPGVVLQINAFNFPVWGMLEKLAPALLAGMPSIVKPATQTAYLTAAVVRDIIDAGVLPEGSLQMLCGDAGALLAELGGGDVIAFTGSANTAATLRGHDAVVRRAARFNAETDSLNCCILGPDAAAGGDEFDLFVKEVAREMTVKAGQKCTAIRRALVPRPAVDAVVDALQARLGRVVVGNPRSDSVTMGALVSVGQRDEVRDAVSALAQAGQVVSGDALKVEPVDADPQRGAFIAPVLLRCDDASRAEPHTVEAFGPVSTVMPYSDAAEAVDIAARGSGSLVGSVVSHDMDFVREVVTGAAPHHGRVLVLDRDCAGESTGHGTPMPQLVHGGPGRAGGGEELGGVRAVKHFMQRTALQGSPAALEALVAAG
ncbi:MAG: phenylacetic acid degradation bifunctional protein PaaZ [Candidatus Dormibacteraeota bacterium]|nr:phenylacetic acid degradation bifunctional protein PaaZ [Candidatus Dormibacteraeota bacterium]MBV9524986.1 phenylacetic acid degradation bifunctional protein PaaZ [Candidatus Dormibacteraeota bacterium]